VRGQGDEGLDLVAVMCLHADGNDGLYGQADRGQVDVRVIAADDATFAKCPDPPKTRGWGDAHRGGEGEVGHPAIGGKQAQDRVVDLIEHGASNVVHRCRLQTFTRRIDDSNWR